MQEALFKAFSYFNFSAYIFNILSCNFFEVNQVMKFNFFSNNMRMIIASSIALGSALLPLQTIAASNQDFKTNAHRDSIINNQTLISSRRASIDVPMDNGMTLRYFRERGRGIILDSEGAEIKRYDGWRTGWNIITYLGRNMILFYDRSNGIGSIYQINNQGNLSPLKDYQGWNRTWNQIDADVASNRVTFRNKQGVVSHYYVDDSGSFHEDHDANESNE